MQGCGALNDAVAAPDPRVFCFSSAGNWETAREPLHRLWESVTPVHIEFMRPGLDAHFATLSDAELAAHEAEHRTSGAGLGLAFGSALAEATGRDIGLIAAAHGGTSLDQWSHERKNQGGHSLYGAMLQRIQMAGGNLRGVLWYQGESDADAQLAATYQARLSAWIADLRAEVGRPNLPVLLVQLGRYVAPPPPEPITPWDTVRAALSTLPESVPHTAATSAIDLGLDDGVHINTSGLIRLGRRLARLATELQNAPDQIAGPRIVSLKTAATPPGPGEVKLTSRNVSGGWLPRDHMSGFSVHDASGAPHPTLEIINVSRDAADATTIRILLSGPAATDVYIAYGLGFNPYCNVVDEADRPLCAFLPRAAN